MNKLINIMRILRGPDGCPWDKRQTFESLSSCLLEESSEIIDAVLEKDYDKITEELGDLLSIISMLIVMGEEKNKFNKDKVIKTAREKMIRRHPHVFAEKKAKDMDSAYQIWHEEKDKEDIIKKRKSVLEDVSKTLPGLSRADKIGRRVAKVGFDWEQIDPAIEKIEEELTELKNELNKKRKSKNKIIEELGDLLFSVVNVGRKLKINSEVALRKANIKFIKRFKRLEYEINNKGKKLIDCSLNELDSVWNSLKKKS